MPQAKVGAASTWSEPSTSIEEASQGISCEVNGLILFLRRCILVQ
jgi:hypothetical protein